MSDCGTARKSVPDGGHKHITKKILKISQQVNRPVLGINGKGPVVQQGIICGKMGKWASGKVGKWESGKSLNSIRTRPQGGWA